MMSSFVIHLFSRSLGIQFVFFVRNELKINDEKYIYVITTRNGRGFVSAFVWYWIEAAQRFRLLWAFIKMEN